MFGPEYKITREYPNYFLDYQVHMVLSVRWTDRLQSQSPDWSGMFLISLLWSQLNLLEILMLKLLGFGEHSGNGVPDIFSIWEEAGLAEPVIEEHFGEDGPNKTVVILPLVAKSAEKKATKKSDEKKITPKTQQQMDVILASMESGEWYRSSDFIEILGVKETRTKELLRRLVDMGKLVDNGATKGRRYQLAENSK